MITETTMATTVECMTTTTTIPSDISAVTTILPATTLDTTTVDYTTEGTTPVITTEVPKAHTTRDITQDTTTIPDIRMEIIKIIIQTILTLIRIIWDTKVTTLTTLEGFLLTMTDSTIKDITKVDSTTIRLPSTEIIMSRQAKVSEGIDILVAYSHIIMT
jgi:hypothetical protein